MPTNSKAAASLRGLEHRAEGPPADSEGVFPVRLVTTEGDICGRLHLCRGDAAGASQVAQIGPRPILFIHGEADEILPSRCSVDLYARAPQPKELILYPGCLHGLDQCRDELDRDLSAWLRRVLGRA